MTTPHWNHHTFILEEVAHLNSPCKDKLCGILYNLCLLLWRNGDEPFGQADLTLPANKKEPIYLQGTSEYSYNSTMRCRSVLHTPITTVSCDEWKADGFCAWPPFLASQRVPWNQTQPSWQTRFECNGNWTKSFFIFILVYCEHCKDSFDSIEQMGRHMWYSCG